MIRAVNHIGIDFDPGPNGDHAQIIAFGRDEDEKKLIASDFATFVDQLVTQFQTVDWNLDLNGGWTINDSQLGNLHYHEWPRSSLI